MRHVYSVPLNGRLGIHTHRNRQYTQALQNNLFQDNLP